MQQLNKFSQLRAAVENERLLNRIYCEYLAKNRVLQQKSGTKSTARKPKPFFILGIYGIHSTTMTQNPKSHHSLSFLLMEKVTCDLYQELPISFVDFATSPSPKSFLGITLLFFVLIPCLYQSFFKIMLLHVFTNLESFFETISLHVFTNPESFFEIISRNHFLNSEDIFCAYLS